MGFTREELERFRDATVPDLVGSNPRLLFVGINPGLWTAATQTHFSYPGNRFYPALREAGILDWEISPSDGMSDEDRRRFVGAGLGITNIVARATARASELSRQELQAGARALDTRIAEWRPSVVAIAGVTAYRTGFGRPKSVMGLQQETLGGCELWVVPNPSGLNAHETIASLAEKYRSVAMAAGVV